MNARPTSKRTADVAAVDAVGLVKRYEDLVAVNDVTLTVEQGDVYGILGPNGAGKTTFLRMLFGLIRPDAGSISLFGRPVAEDSVAALDRVGGFIETPRFYTYLSAETNLRVLARLDRDRATRARIGEVLALVDLAGREKDKVGTYSYGMRQRLGVAASLLRDPKLLVIDEPTNGLDPAGMRDMRALVKQLASTGLTVLLSSHNMSEVEEICQHATIMREGNVVFHGSLGELRELAPETEYALVASDAQAALAVCVRQDGISRAHLDAGAVRFLASEVAVERLTLALGREQIAFRSLAPTRGALETLFFRLTGSDQHLHFAEHESEAA